MPHHPEDARYPHLPLVREEPTPDRRRRPAPPGPPPNRGGRGRYSKRLEESANELEEQVEGREPPPAGIEPHLVFRVPLAPHASSQNIADLLENLGLTVVAIEGDGAIVAFRAVADLTAFRDAAAAYGRGPQTGINPQTGQAYKSTQWDGLAWIDAAGMSLWSKPDRIGRRLAASVGGEGESVEPDALYVVDVELWHRGTDELARAAVEELRQLVNDDTRDGESVHDYFVGSSLCLARLAVRGNKLNALLSLDVVAEVEVPPRPSFDPRMAFRTTKRDFDAPPPPPPDGPSVCVVDSGVTSNHPLLAPYVGGATSVRSGDDAPADENGHGTAVAGVAVYGSVRDGYEKGAFGSAIRVFSAKVLNAANEFDDEKLIISQMREAIEAFVGSPYSCRVFNMSFGSPAAWLRDNDRQSLWAEQLDILARELDVVIVVSAGNQSLGQATNAADAERVLTTYPGLLFEPECGLCEPATAAIAVTVGGVAEHSVQSVALGRKDKDIQIAVAAVGEPTPTSRVGLGLNAAVKPEFVGVGGNLSFQGFSGHREVKRDPGLAVMSLSHRPTERLFAFDNGTSLAAPQVSRAAAIALANLRETFETEPSANLVRAVLASTAEPPAVEEDRIEPTGEERAAWRCYGYGRIDEEVLEASGDRRVTLVAEEEIPLDTFAVFEVPAPPEFRAAPGDKRVIVTLAFDPPVRRRRADYLGVKMDHALIRGKTVDEIVDAYRQLSTQEVKAAKAAGGVQGAFRSPFRCNLDPGPQFLASSTLQRSAWTFRRENSDYGETWYLVVRAQRTWAPASFENQRFGVTVTLEADEPRLYNLVFNRLRLRQQQRARARR
ncbi:S8 family peptidase [Alienimonas chondri]|uniref:Peptidase S8/S53 domain-containing protein n=1 Tax=Alienimonas chondri TaxID=2681879 RepID=A0ABX1VC23_9PLAN|nr:S8 family peptidase [Alienimonas chondri]NNJ25660.1 hypothetical protein [Alienimonas chondri]